MFESIDPTDFLFEDLEGSSTSTSKNLNGNYTVCKQRSVSRALSCLDTFSEDCLLFRCDMNNAAIDSPGCKQITTVESTGRTTSCYNSYALTDVQYDLNSDEPRSDTEQPMLDEIEKLLMSAEVKVDKTVKSLNISLVQLQRQLLSVCEVIKDNSQSFKQIAKASEDLNAKHGLKIMDLLRDMEMSTDHIAKMCEIIGTQILNSIQYAPQVDFSLDVNGNYNKFNARDTHSLPKCRKLAIASKEKGTGPYQTNPNDYFGDDCSQGVHNNESTSMQRGSPPGLDYISMINDFTSSPTAISPIGTMPVTVNTEIKGGAGRLIMQIMYKFGSLGASAAQFNSPHGLCLGVNEEIIVADTNNHRIGVFEKNGSLKFQFGVPGKEAGQLWYPRRVAVMRTNSKFVVCDRGSGRSRMQIFTKSGHFAKRIFITYIGIVACLAVTNDGRIVVVDSVVPSVYFISEDGPMLRWFKLGAYVIEPSDVAISGSHFYICDFKGHRVAVFTEDGIFQNHIGHKSITQYPNGIYVSDAGDVFIGDSHGSHFHVASYSRNGALQSEFICPHTIVSRCCGLKITSEGYIVTLAKNNHHVLVLNTCYKFSDQQPKQHFGQAHR